MYPTEMDRWASAMHALRPDWRHDSLRTFAASNLATRPYRDACVAGAWVATDPDTRTPHLLTMDGPWWAACQPPSVRPTEPGIVTYCEHGEPGSRCIECFPRLKHQGVGPTPEQRAAMRQALATAKTDRKDRA